MLLQTRHLVVVLALALATGACGDGEQSTGLNTKSPGSEIPVYTDFEELERRPGGNSSRRVVQISYRSSAGFDDVRGFYQSKLESDGWTLAHDSDLTEATASPGARKIQFEKGRETLGIEYAGEHPKGKWTYFVVHGIAAQ